MKETYDPNAIELKWQRVWAQAKAFETTEDPGRPKYYLLEMYPYPSGRIHMGHVRNYSIGDVIARFKAMNGLNVLHPIGWDALGMPAENAAIKHGIHPQTWTLDNIAYMKKQLQRMGFSYDWSREVNSCLPEYYQWNQWIFLKMLEKGLAFRKESWVNWCPKCATVLANEQVVGGACWRCESEVSQKRMEQWFLRTTAYAEELLSGHAELVGWPDHVLQMQKNWIGRSLGAHVNFAVPALRKSIEVFTTRIDTIFGATFLVLSPEHPLVRELIRGPREKELQARVEQAVNETRLKRDLGEAEKEGLDTGVTAVNPYTGAAVPIWVSSYVLMDYGTGAIMAVPAHDSRDFAFARKYGLPIKTVIAPADKADASVAAETDEAFEDEGVLIASGPFSGLRSAEAMEKMARFAEDKGFGRASVTFRLRDWGISRQRYWGTPIPVVYCPTCGIVGVPLKDLPVLIPHDVQITGEEGSPLERVESFVRTTCPTCGGPARRETDTMDTFVDSSWYFFRYCSPSETRLPFAPEAARHWMPVDLYIGGVEHAILHLIYARFFTKVLRDLGLTSVDEPFPHYLAQGMVTKDGSAMSKSRGNTVDPDGIISSHGADALRLFILFASPPDKEFAWSTDGLEGCGRFLNRLWVFFRENLDVFAAGGAEAAAAPPEVRRKTHQTIRRVSEDIGVRFHLNTAISGIMEFYNFLKRERDALRQTPAGRAGLREALEALILLLAPFAPHLAEELREAIGTTELLARSTWPSYDPELARDETVTIVVQVGGRLRDRFETAAGTAEAELEAAALGLERIRAVLGGKPPRKVICVKDKLVNIVP